MKAKTFLGAAIVIAAGAFQACSSSSPANVVDAGPKTAANGTVGEWSSGPAMPKPRANHCVVATQGFLIVIGGNYSADPTAQNPVFTDLDEVDAAPIAENGTLGDWKKIGTTPSPVNSCTAASFGDTIYLLSGIYDDPTVGSSMYSAKLDSHGNLSPFTAAGTIPADDDLFYSTAWVDGPDGGESLNAFNVALPDDTGADAGSVTIAHASLSALSDWQNTPFLPAFRGHPEYAFTSGFAYVLGGYPSADDAGMDFPEQAFGVARGANAGAPFSTTALPKGTMFGDAVAVDGYVFVIGGRDSTFGDDPRADVNSAPINSDGTLGAWTAQNAMPDARTDERVIAYGNYVYVVGGGDTGPGLDSVYIAQIRF